ncbi:ankyrin repeats (3 copies) domain-containing protein [Trichoderma breve]|uniref:Ankyrin repeats (3 copies) domain-containing protein n=1 Tax=Trichoderma breve TaxID=2034170 RepID=A0A9W9E733_9HYPO|nr:ankyrin repeats (3 copies) domain-containing protein [Trichoderma breve]KAJ4859940.1 ankyrin repeats (3 copies) domain-containing protein [Trichoderma breve]
MSIPEDPLERRRLQNRMAQRRFRSRQKNQEQRNAIELASQLQSAAASLYSESVNMEGRLEDFSSTANTAHDASSLRGGYSASLNGVGGIHESFSLFDSNNRHDHFVGLDANGNCIPYALSEPVPSTISTSPGNSSPLDVLGSGRMQHRNSSPAHSDNYFSSEDHLLESAIIATNDLMKTTNFGSPDLSSADTSPRASDSCAMSDPGWLSALHMAARRGHGGIVRLLLQNCMDTNEPDSDGLTPLMHAAAGGHEEVVGLLLSHGARLGDRDNRRRSVLHWAVLTYREAVLRLLLKHAATDDPLLIDAYDESGCSPLHAAIDSGFEIGVSILMEFGVNIHSRARKP